MDDRAVERLKWKSRRGLLELDIVLERFWKEAGRRMSEDDAAALEQLLALPDNDLLDLVMGRTERGDARLAKMIDALRAA